MADTEAVPGCTFCDHVKADIEPPGGWVYRDGYVRSYAFSSGPLADWVVIHVDRHAEGLAGLNEAEAAAFGKAASVLARAMVERTGETKTYGYTLCEHVPHFHALFGPPPAVGEGEKRGRPLLVRILEGDPAFIDAEASVREAEALKVLVDKELSS